MKKLCVITLLLVLLVFIAYIIVENENNDDGNDNKQYEYIKDKILDKCSEYIKDKYEYEGCSISEEEKTISIAFSYDNRTLIDAESIEKIYNEVYLLFFVEHIDKYKEYTLDIDFSYIGIGFNIYDITVNKDKIRLINYNEFTVKEMVTICPEAFEINCEELLYDSIEEIGGFNNLNKVYCKREITDEERWKILREFPKCQVSYGDVYIENDDEKTNIYTFKGYYTYPVQAESLSDENVEKCRISYKVLETMTTEQVAQAVVDYPFIEDICSWESFDTIALRKKSDAYAEILMREDGREELIRKISELDCEEYNIDLLKQIVLNEKIFADTFAEDELDYLTND